MTIQVTEEPTPPPLSIAAQLCDVVSQIMPETAYLPHREPGIDLEEYDAKWGSGAMPDPLTNSHKLARFYLIGAGDFLYSIGKLLALDEPMIVSPGVLARCVAEYSSLCWFLSDEADSPEKRMSKMAALFADGFNNWGANRKDADPGVLALARGINNWRSSKPSLPKVKVPSSTDLVEKFDHARGRKEYDLLSRLVHANATTLSVVTISAQLKSSVRVMDSWRHALFAAHCGIHAAMLACVMRDGDKTSINHCVALYDEAARVYNEYWDLVEEAGEGVRP